MRVVWLSDGGRGLWSVFQRLFQAVRAVAILDFYHAAQNLYKGASAWLDGRTRACQQWFADLRHRPRHGHEQHVLAELAALVEATHLPQSARQTLTNVYTYLKTHEDHIHYEHFKAAGLPIGRGLVESACKWLIQQRFKGVGMRWSEAGFIICSISDWRGLTNDSIASSQIGCPPPTRRYAPQTTYAAFAAGSLCSAATAHNA